jgi:hypothetical protein
VFDKRRAIQSAVKKIKDENSIIFLMDLHIIAPVSIIQLVRKVRFLYKHQLFTCEAHGLETINFEVFNM